MPNESMVKLNFINVILAYQARSNVGEKAKHSHATGKKHEKRLIVVLLFGVFLIPDDWWYFFWCTFATISLMIWSALFFIVNSGDVN